MDGITFTKKNKFIKTINIIFASIFLFLFAFFVYKRYLINYAYIYPNYKSSSIEYSLFYTAMAIVSSLSSAILFLLALVRKKTSKMSLIVYPILFLIIVVTVVICLKMPIVNEYTSVNKNDSKLSYFPIDEYEYSENSEDYYYYREVTLNDVYWIGSMSYKDFAAENSLVDWTEEVYDSTVFMNYYYLKDNSGKRIKEYNKKKNLYDLISVNSYDSIVEADNYIVYEYEDNYEFILQKDNEIFYLSASKNKRTDYDINDIIRISNNLLKNLELN